MNVSGIEFELLQGLVIDETWRVFDAIIFLFSLIIGSVFYWGTIHYEKYGGDPMKRSLQNKLVSTVSFSLILEILALIYFSSIPFLIKLNLILFNEYPFLKKDLAFASE